MKSNKKQLGSKKNILIIAGSIALVAVIAILTLATGGQTAPETASQSDNADIVIQKEQVTQTASYYPVESNGTYMEIIAVRATDGTVRTALNTCQVCYASGQGYYEQLGEALICKNCGNQFTIDQIELQKGGCNPVPILADMKTEDDETVTINAESLVVYEPLFANWNK